jgi:hypothetical protein
MVACISIAGMEIVVGSADLAGGGGLVESADGHQQPPIQDSSPSATSAGTARLEGVRSWRWTPGLGACPATWIS